MIYTNGWFGTYFAKNKIYVVESTIDKGKS